MLTFECAGCGAAIPASGTHGWPFACPSARAGDDIDHLVRRAKPAVGPLPRPDDPNPFVRYRSLLAAHALAVEIGVGDQAFVNLVRALDTAIADLDGTGFRATPFGPSPALATRIGLPGSEVWVKDETGNVAGSHKARHLMGLMLWLQVAATQADAGRAAVRPGRLAIASCGNAALAAAVVARAAGWPLDVFVPPSAARSVLDHLERLSAAITTCQRVEGVPGDPCYLAFRRALGRGAVPFCCQGSDNGLTIDGGKTLAWEMVSALPESPAGTASHRGLDAIFVQVGGGALASAVAQGFGDALSWGAIGRLPRFYAVQTRGAFPLRMAYDAVADRVLARAKAEGLGLAARLDRERADLIAGHPSLVDEEMAFARLHRSAFMRPWATPPQSVAHGILDDETYDWAAVVEAMLKTGGWPLVVDEGLLREANATAREATGVNVDHTGSAGLAGLVQAAPLDSRLANERIGVLFTSVSRG